jgi:hypothetical protein
MTIRYYRLKRTIDVSNVSGTGVPAVVVESPNGEVTMYWRSKQIGRQTQPSIMAHPNLDNAKTVHCHDGASEFVEAVTANEIDWVIEVITKVMRDYADAVANNHSIFFPRQKA